MNTNDILRVALASREPGAFWSLEHFKAMAELFALCAAGVFFIYKFLTGYFFINLSVSLLCERKHSTKPDRDLLLVCVKLEKGDRGSLRIHDAQARITYLSDKTEVEPVRFRGNERSSYNSQKMGAFDRKTINWAKQSEETPFLRLAPGEKTEYACVFEVPRNDACLIDVAILGRRGVPSLERFRHVGQWKASSVSLPL